MDKIAVASDHGALSLKGEIVDLLKSMDVEVLDLGTDSDASVDYPDFGSAVADLVSKGEVDRGILLCGTGIGMSIVANKYNGVRGALVNDTFSARMAKEHNNANILILGGRVTGGALACEIVSTWIKTEFEGGRHQRRLDKISEIEERVKGGE